MSNSPTPSSPLSPVRALRQNLLLLKEKMLQNRSSSQNNLKKNFRQTEELNDNDSQEIGNNDFKKFTGSAIAQLECSVGDNSNKSSSKNFLSESAVPSPEIKKAKSAHNLKSEVKVIEESTECASNVSTSPSLSSSFFKSSKNYEKGPLIGTGSFGKVYLSTSLESGQKFAIKEIVFKNVLDMDYLEKQMADIQREISLLKQFQHPNIVQYYGAEIVQNAINEGDTNNDGATVPTLRIFLEYVGGGSLGAIIKEHGKLDESTVQNYTKQILFGLKYLHDKQIAHRDIKGPNILTNKGKFGRILKLADFGTSKQLEKDRSTGEFKTLVGTPQFMAPEVILQTGHGRRADIWSLGCVVCEMLTGLPPFVEFKTYFAIMNHIITTSEPPSLPASVSAEAKEFILKCFERDPKKRATCDELLAHSWMKYVQMEKNTTNNEQTGIIEPELHSALQ